MRARALGKQHAANDQQGLKFRSLSLKIEDTSLSEQHTDDENVFQTDDQSHHESPTTNRRSSGTSLERRTWTGTRDTSTEPRNEKLKELIFGPAALSSSEVSQSDVEDSDHEKPQRAERKRRALTSMDLTEERSRGSLKALLTTFQRRASDAGTGSAESAVDLQQYGPQVAESLNLWQSMVSQFLSRLLATNTTTLNRRLRKTFEMQELTNLSNSLIDNILVDIENMKHRFPASDSPEGRLLDGVVSVSLYVASYTNSIL
jgi:hypothetical protein